MSERNRRVKTEKPAVLAEVAAQYYLPLRRHLLRRHSCAMGARALFLKKCVVVTVTNLPPVPGTGYNWKLRG